MKKEIKTRNSTYVIDEENKTITGGNLGDSVAVYMEIVQLAVGSPFIIDLENEEFIRTSAVQSIA